MAKDFFEGLHETIYRLNDTFGREALKQPTVVLMFPTEYDMHRAEVAMRSSRSAREYGVHYLAFKMQIDGVHVELTCPENEARKQGLRLANEYRHG